MSRTAERATTTRRRSGAAAGARPARRPRPTTPDAAAHATLGVRPPSGTPQVVILSGLSGGGKSQAAKLFEDLGFSCIDNLPPDLLEAFLDLRQSAADRYRDVALVLDIRSGDPAPAIARARSILDRQGASSTVIYLEASDAVLISRFSETRHRHPLESRSGVQASISEERSRLAATRELADHIVDTSGLSIGQLKERLFALVPTEPGTDVTQVEIITFGFKFGIPLEADFVFDVRFLNNPFWVPDLKPLSGLHASVRDYVLRQPRAQRFLELVEELLDLTLPAYRAEGKPRLVVALGCTGGYHRSIALAEELADHLKGREGTNISVFHRELER